MKKPLLTRPEIRRSGVLLPGHETQSAFVDLMQMAQTSAVWRSFARTQNKSSLSHLMPMAQTSAVWRPLLRLDTGTNTRTYQLRAIHEAPMLNTGAVPLHHRNQLTSLTSQAHSPMVSCLASSLHNLRTCASLRTYQQGVIHQPLVFKKIAVPLYHGHQSVPIFSV